MLDWNDLRFLLAVARHGSTIAAADALKVNQSTVQRRLSALDATLGQPTVVRTRAGYALTAFGTALLPQARAVEAAADSLAAEAARLSGQAGGHLRITCPEPIVQRLMPLIERFQRRHPEFQVELVTSDRYLDLAKGDADIAFRSGDTDADLIGRKIADSIWAVYGSPAYLQRAGRPKDLEGLRFHRLVSLDEGMSRHRVVGWLSTAAPGARIVARASSILGMIQSVRSGVGLGALPANIADADPGLIRIFGPVPELTRTWKILTPKALRQEPRIVAFFNFVQEEKESVRAILN